MNNEYYHLILGSLSFPFPNMKPPDGTDPPLVTSVVIYTVDVSNYLSGEEITLYSELTPVFENEKMELAIQVAVLVGPSGIIYYKIAMDYIRSEAHNSPILLKAEGDFILIKRTLPYEENFDPQDLVDGQNTPPPNPVLRSAVCDHNYVADANVVLDSTDVEEWLSRFGQMEIGKNMLYPIFSAVPEYGNYSSNVGFINQHSAGWIDRDPDVPLTTRSHFYKAESSFNSIPMELYRNDYYKVYTWQLLRPELFDKYGGHTHYSLAYQFNQKGSYYRQGIDGNQWYPSNTDPAQYSKYEQILGDGANGNLLPYQTPTEFEEHLSPENFYDINLKRTLHFSDRDLTACAMLVSGTYMTGLFLVYGGNTFYKYNIYVKSPLYREFMTGGRLGLYANFSDRFKPYKTRVPLIDEDDSHTIYEGDQSQVEYTTVGSDNNPSPTGKDFEKTMRYWEQYIFAGGDALGFAYQGFISGATKSMVHWPHDGFVPSLVFDVNWTSSAESKIVYPIVDGESTDPKDNPVSDEEEEDTELVTTLMTTSLLQTTHSLNLEMQLSTESIDLEINEDKPTDLYKSINFLPISKYEAIFNVPEKDSSLKDISVEDADIGSYFGRNFNGDRFKDYIYWACVDGPIIITPPKESDKPSEPNLAPLYQKLLVCFGSDLEVSMVDHAKICNRCYNMVRTTACTASSMPSPLLNDKNKVNKRTILPSNMTFALESNSNMVCKYGTSPPNPRNFYLDKHIPSTETNYEGGILNLPVIENTSFNYNWKNEFKSIWSSNPPIDDPDLRSVTAFRPWRDKINYGRGSVYGRNGLARSTIFDYAWNLSIDGKQRETAENSRPMKIPQGTIQMSGFADMVGNVPVNTMYLRTNEAGMIHGGLYACNKYSYAKIDDISPATVFSGGGFTLIGLMAQVGVMGMSAGSYLHAYMAFNKADYVNGLVISALYNHTPGEIGTALGSGCSNISIYTKKVNLESEWETIPDKVYQYYGYATSPHYIGLHPEGYLWIPTDVGYYIHNDTGKITTPETEKFIEERKYEWCHPLLRTGFINTNFAVNYPTAEQKVTTAILEKAQTWDEEHTYEDETYLLRYSGGHITDYTGSNWDSVPLVKASEIYKDTVFTVVGSYGQVTNGDSSYWRYVENFLIRDLSNKDDLAAFNLNN